VVHPYIQAIGIPLQWEDIILFGAREEKIGASSLKCQLKLLWRQLSSLGSQAPL
jgi:hypothetical protein